MAETQFGMGDVIADRFEVSEILGVFVSHVVYQTVDKESNQPILIEELLVPVDDELFQTFESTVDAVNVSHPHLVDVYGLGRDESLAILLRAYIEGQTLRQLLASRRADGKTLKLKGATRIADMIASATQALHDLGLGHGLLNDDNILINEQGHVQVAGNVTAQLIWHAVDEDRRRDVFSGLFVAPEVSAPNAYLSPAADVYALGMLLIELLSTTSLHDAEDLNEAIRATLTSVPESIRKFLMRSINPDASQRPVSASAWSQVLKGIMEGLTRSSGSALAGLDPTKLPPARSGETAALTSGDMASALPPPRSGASSVLDFAPPPRSGVTQISGNVSAVSEVVPIPDDGSVNPDDEMWLVKKEGMDYGPFTAHKVVDMLRTDEIDEHAAITNINTGKAVPMHTIGVFNHHVLEYIPIREERLAKEAAEREKLLKQAKTASAFSGVGILAAVIFFVVTGIIAYLQLPDPEPTQFAALMTSFPLTYEIKRPEPVELAVAGSILDPEGTEEAQRKAWEAFRRKNRPKPKNRKRRRSRKSKTRSATSKASEDDDFDDFTTDLGNAEESDLPDLDDQEIFDLVYGDRTMRKVTACIDAEKNRSGRYPSSFKVKFWIKPTGSLAKLRTNKDGELDMCLKGAFGSIRFRPFGGGAKKVEVPFNFR